MEHPIALLADCHLGKTAKYLRLLGIDTLYFEQISDNALIELAKKEKRIILTKDRDLYQRIPEIAFYVTSQEYKQQLEEIISSLNLQTSLHPFKRCMQCNGLLSFVEKEAIQDELQELTLKYYDRFAQCQKCRKIYWEGSHYSKMEHFVEELLKKFRE